MSEEETITITKTQLWQGVSGVLVLALALVVFAGLPSGGETTTATGNDPSPAAGNNNNAGQQGATAVEVPNLENEPSIGEDDAPVKVVKFTDFGCPFCQRWHSQTQDQIINEYVESGDVQIVYKDTPIPQLHPDAPKAHEAANCVYEQDQEAYWDYVETLYSNQNTQSESNLVQWASDLGYDIQDCLDSGEFESEVNEDISEAEAAQFQGTPHFLVNDQTVRGAQPFNAFQQAIESQLN